MANQNEQLDTSIVSLARAIAQSESGGDYNAKGKSGEYGAYQFTQPTWKEWAGKHLNNSDAPMNPENQDKVAYSQIKDWGSQGYNPAQIASLWNSGKPDPTGNIGVNKYGVKYDTPAYVKSVENAYNTIRSGGSVGVDKNNPSFVQQEESPSIGGFLGNVVKSGANFAGGIGNAILHPLDTIGNLGKLGSGLIQLGEGALAPMAGQKVDTPETQAVGNVVDFYKNRYGGVSNIANTLYSDPVGSAADLSVLLSGGSGLIGGVGKLAGLSDATRLASSLSRVSELTNPINAVTKGIGLVGKIGNNAATRILGNTSGIGTEGAKMALAGNTDYMNAARGMEGFSPEELVQTAKTGVSSLSKKVTADYQKGLVGVNKNFENLSPIEQQSFKFTALQKAKDALNSSLQKFKVGMSEDGKLDFSSSGINPNFQSDVKNIFKDINGWNDFSPEGVNTLENRIYSYYDKINSSPVNTITTKISNDLKGFLRESVPDFKTMDNAYQQTKKILGEMKKDLNIGGTAGAQTIFNKIAKVAKDNNDLRVGTLQALNKLTGRDLQSWALGLKAQSWMPSGLMGRLGEIGSFVHPQLLGALLTTSPRSVIAFLRTLGWAETKAIAFAEKINLAKNALYAGEIQNIGQAESTPSPQ